MSVDKNIAVKRVAVISVRRVRESLIMLSNKITEQRTYTESQLIKNTDKKCINFRVITVKHLKSKAVVVTYDLFKVKTQLKITSIITQTFKINVKVKNKSISL